MRGPKLNEGATVATLASGARHGTKATAKYVRVVGLQGPRRCST